MKNAVMRPMLGFASALAFFAGGAMAHDDPREMGAGPGVATADHHDQSHISDAEALAEKTQAMDDGTPPPIDDDAMADMDHGALETMGHDHGADNSDKGFGERLFIWFGKLHSVVIHFPIALIIGAFGFEILGLARQRPHWRAAARTMLVAGAIGAVVASSLGWFAGGFYLYDRNLVLTAHRYLGMAITLASVALAWAGLRFFAVENGRKRGFAVLLALLSIAVTVQGFLGGTFMHGGLGHMNF